MDLGERAHGRRALRALRYSGQAFRYGVGGEDENCNVTTANARWPLSSFAEIHPDRYGTAGPDPRSSSSFRIVTKPDV